MINTLLNDMTVEDLHRRYSNTFIRYDGEIIFVHGFDGLNVQKSIKYVTNRGIRVKPFDGNLLDASRPAPRWIKVDDKSFYYINYLFERQWHRGFCKSNTVVRNRLGDKTAVGDGMIMFQLLDILYNNNNDQRLRYSMKDVYESVAAGKSLLLSPQILISPDVAKNPLVLFREKVIGYFGKVEKYFVQELKESIGDYVNEDHVQPVSRPARKVGRAVKINRVEELPLEAFQWQELEAIARRIGALDNAEREEPREIL